MSRISDELRKCADTYDDKKFLPKINGRYHDIADRIDAEMAELPRGKDGKPIHVGETVYGEDGKAWHVEGVVIGRWTEHIKSPVVYATGGSGQWRNFLPWLLTHERPDSLERIARELGEWRFEHMRGLEADDFNDLSLFADRIRKLAKERGHES
jgi:hypothetical protein